jgi:2-iminobutanoate/2-iminopropanoate deaminase
METNSRAPQLRINERISDMDKVKINTDAAPKAIGPYSQAIQVGNMIFCSGQIPLSPTTGSVVSESVIDQTHQVLKNMKAVLESAGSNLSRVIKTTIFLQEMNDFTEVNKIYSEYFCEPYPARSTVQVAKLPLGVKVEIEAVALTI